MKAFNEENTLSNSDIALLAMVAGGAIANGYAIQPSLSSIADEFNVPVAHITLVSSISMVGYLAGLVLLVPMVDRANPKVLISGQMAVLALFLVLASTATTPFILAGYFFIIGAFTTVAAQCSAVVGKYSLASKRAQSMSVVSAGISAGILLSRYVEGMLAQSYGWRGAIFAFAAYALLAALLIGVMLPKLRTSVHAGYFEKLREVPRLLHQSAQLRKRTYAGMLWFFAFNLIWVGIAIQLAAPPYNFGAADIGAFSLAGLLGLCVTRIAGRLSDRFSSRMVTSWGMAAAAISAVVLSITIGNVMWTAFALATFDAGCFAAQVANQSSVVAIDPARSGSLNSAYLTCYYMAGTIGTAAAGTLLTLGGWTTVSLTSAIAAIAAALLSATANDSGEAGGI